MAQGVEMLALAGGIPVPALWEAEELAPSIEGEEGAK
jgi:hypothetical protein